MANSVLPYLAFAKSLDVSNLMIHFRVWTPAGHMFAGGEAEADAAAVLTKLYSINSFQHKNKYSHEK